MTRQILRVLVCGGRDYSDRGKVYRELNKLCGEVNPLGTVDLVIIHGASRGADSIADDWAVANRCQVLPFPVNKDDWYKYGKAAGPIRNKQMLVEGKPDVVLAFPGGNGTADMIEQARKVGIRIIEVE